MSEKNYYTILGLSDDDRNLNENEFNDKLKKVYKNLARKWHPDKFSTKSEEERKDAEEKFKEISEAYNTLSDPQKRQEYDFRQGGGNGFDPFDGFNPWDIFNRGQASPRQQMFKGQNVDVEVTITLEEAFNGGEKEVTYNTKTMCGHCNGTGSADGKTHTCPHCNGAGVISERRQHGNMTMINNRPCPHCNGSGKTFSDPCPHCNGEGYKAKKTTVEVKIPAGIASHQQLRITGKGERGYNGGPNGDLYIEIIVNDHPQFKRDGSDIHVDVPISFADAALGCTIDVPTAYGDVELRIPEGVQHGQVFRLKGKGFKSIRGAGIGDQMVKVLVKTPTRLSREERELFEKLRDADKKSNNETIFEKFKKAFKR
jgi:molecular chaperone DnaJ